MAKKTDIKSDQKKHIDAIKYNTFPLVKSNFILMAICGIMIIAGFLLMLGAPNGEEAFNPDIFSTRRIVVGPTIAFLGFLFMAFAIIYKKKEPKKD